MARVTVNAESRLEERKIARSANALRATPMIQLRSLSDLQAELMQDAIQLDLRRLLRSLTTKDDVAYA